MKYAFENTLPGCPLQKLIADICACKIAYGGDFVSEVLMRLAAVTVLLVVLGHEKAHYIEDLAL